MAKFSAVTEAEVALSAATAKTVLILTGGTTRTCEITGIGIAFDGVSSTAEPVQVRVVRASTTGTTTACTEKWWTDAGSTPVGAAGYNASAEPTKESASLIATEVHPQGGSMVLSWAKGEGIKTPLTANAGIAIECTAPATVNCRAWIEWWE